MILKMIISVILLYYLAVLWQYFRHDLMRSFWKTDAEEADDEPEEKTDEPYTVIGKSTYRKRQTDEPDDKQRRADNQADKTDNFAPGTPGNDTEKQLETATGASLRAAPSVGPRPSPPTARAICLTNA